MFVLLFEHERRQNELEELPGEVGGLLDLKTLSVSSNRLASLPASVGQLVLLEFLFANGNRLLSLPPELAGLMKLRKVRDWCQKRAVFISDGRRLCIVGGGLSATYSSSALRVSR